MDYNLPLALHYGKIITPDTYTFGLLLCPGCNKTMHFRKKHKRKLDRMECNVRSTFVHKLAFLYQKQ